MTNDEIIAQARGVNVGDVALGRRPDQVRSDKQKFALRANIEPGDLINKNHPTLNYQFAWVPFKDSDFYHDLKDEGYRVVTESEWVNARETREWYQPDKALWRWSATKMLVNRDEFAMYRDEDAWKRECLNRLQASENSIKGRTETAYESANQLVHDKGLEVEIEMGKPNAAGVRRTTA